jgi:glycosyltransferase involved in cell wall biosynthesis
MNILYLTTHLNAGGITTYLLTLAKGMKANGHKVTVVSSGGNKSEEFRKEGLTLVNLNIHTKSEASWRLYAPLPRLTRYIQRERIDVIHTQMRVTHVMGQLLSVLTQKPLVTTCHGFYKTRFFRRIFPCWGKAVIAISPAVGEHLAKDFHVDRKRITLIRNGIDFNLFPLLTPDQKNARRKALNLPERATLIGIIARLADVKGHTVLIQSMAKIVNSFPQTYLLIVGQGKMEVTLKRQVQELQLQERVLFIPTVNLSGEYLSIIDIFVMPSLSEGLGISLMEAQATGLPVVATRVGGIPTLIEHQKTGLLVDPDNAQQLADQLLSLLKDAAKGKQLGLAAREFIARECSAQKMVDQTYRVYQNVVAT